MKMTLKIHPYTSRKYPDGLPHDFRHYDLHPAILEMLIKMAMDRRTDEYRNQTGDDGDGCPVICGDPSCGYVIPLVLSHHARFVLVHTGSPGIAPIHCTHISSSWDQHFACSREHLRNAIMECYDNHVGPVLDSMEPIRDQVLPQFSLDAAKERQQHAQEDEGHGDRTNSITAI